MEDTGADELKGQLRALDMNGGPSETRRVGVQIKDSKGNVVERDEGGIILTCIYFGVGGVMTVEMCIHNAHDMWGNGYTIEGALPHGCCVEIDMDSGETRVVELLEEGVYCWGDCRMTRSPSARRLLPSFEEAKVNYMSERFMPYAQRYETVLEELRGKCPQEDLVNASRESIKGVHDLLKFYSDLYKESAVGDEKTPFEEIIRETETLSNEYSDLLTEHSEVSEKLIQNCVYSYAIMWDMGEDAAECAFKKSDACSSQDDALDVDGKASSAIVRVAMESKWQSFWRAHQLSYTTKEEENKWKLAFIQASLMMKTAVGVHSPGKGHSIAMQFHPRNPGEFPVPRTVVKIDFGEDESLALELNLHRCLKRMGYMDMDGIDNKDMMRLFFTDKEAWEQQRTINWQRVVGDDWKALNISQDLKGRLTVRMEPSMYTALYCAEDISKPHTDPRSISGYLDDESPCQESVNLSSVYYVFHIHINIAPKVASGREINVDENPTFLK